MSTDIVKHSPQPMYSDIVTPNDPIVTHKERNYDRIKNEIMIEFEKTVEEKIAELKNENETKDNDATTLYTRMCTAINFAVDKTLPTRPRGTGVHRKVSEDTK